VPAEEHARDAGHAGRLIIATTTKKKRTTSNKRSGARRTPARAATASEPSRRRRPPSSPSAHVRGPVPRGRKAAPESENGEQRWKRTKAPGAREKGTGTHPERVREIIHRLDTLYPGATCALVHRSPWELLVATILSAQCTDVRVNMVTPELFRKYPTVHDFAALRPELLEPDIRSTGFFRNKAKSIVGAARKVVSGFRGSVPETMNEMLQLPGVARKTANVVLGTAYGHATGLVVDTHVQRVGRRLDLTAHEDPVKIEQDLMKVIPKEKWIEFSHQVIWHGRKLCAARKPLCADCLLDSICYAADKTTAPGTAMLSRRAGR